MFSRRQASLVFLSLSVCSAVTAQLFSPPPPPDQIPIQVAEAPRQIHPTRCRNPILIGHDQDPLQCGLIKVPLDWSDPSAGYGQVYFSRYPASPNVARKGTIFVDAGFPFAVQEIPGSETWMYIKGRTLHDRTGGEYDLVTWRMRGTGTDTEDLTIPGPMKCFKNGTESHDFYKSVADELGFEYPWNDYLQYKTVQGEQDIRRWHAVQERLVQHCLDNTDKTMLRYIGTAANVRDLVAMADAFDGAESPINFWGMGRSSLVGSYLLEMFPERAGRILLDNPSDPVTYAQVDPYETWKEEIIWANSSLEAFAKGCRDDQVRGCRLVKADGKESGWIINVMSASVSMARATFVGWRNQLNVDLDNAAYRRFLETVYEHTDHRRQPGNPSLDIATVNHLAQSADEVIGLGLMPIVCGDLAFDHDSEEMRRRASRMPDDLVKSSSIAPLIMQTVVPSLQYMCHLWPIRAVERWSDTRVEEPKPAPNPVLVLSNDMNPLYYPIHGEWVARPPWSHGKKPYDADIVMQTQFGVPSFAHSTCMSDQISSYLQNGTMPLRHQCYGNGLEEWPEVLQYEAKPTVDH